MAIYSTLLWQGATTSSLQTVYTVPSGFVSVVRSVDWWNGDTGAHTLYLVSNVSGSFQNALIAVVNNLGAGQGSHWDGRHVLPTGAALEIGALGSGVLVAISGYQLSGP